MPAELPTLTRDVVAYQPDQEVLDFIADLEPMVLLGRHIQRRSQV
mgnify:CR=1 FL=1